MAEDFNNEAILEWAIQNPVIIYSFSTIFRPFSIFGIATNQVDFPSVSRNDVNTGKTNDKENTVIVAKKTSDGENAIAIESDIRNERVGESKGGVNSIVSNERARELNRNAKVGLKV